MFYFLLLTFSCFSFSQPKPNLSEVKTSSAIQSIVILRIEGALRKRGLSESFNLSIALSRILEDVEKLSASNSSKNSLKSFISFLKSSPEALRGEVEGARYESVFKSINVSDLNIYELFRFNENQIFLSQKGILGIGSLIDNSLSISKQANLIIDQFPDLRNEIKSRNLSKILTVSSVKEIALKMNVTVPDWWDDLSKESEARAAKNVVQKKTIKILDEARPSSKVLESGKFRITDFSQELQFELNSIFQEQAGQKVQFSNKVYAIDEVLKKVNYSLDDFMGMRISVEALESREVSGVLLISLMKRFKSLLSESLSHNDYEKYLKHYMENLGYYFDVIGEFEKRGSASVSSLDQSAFAELILKGSDDFSRGRNVNLKLSLFKGMSSFSSDLLLDIKGGNFGLKDEIFQRVIRGIDKLHTNYLVIAKKKAHFAKGVLSEGDFKIFAKELLAYVEESFPINYASVQHFKDFLSFDSTNCNVHL